MLDSGYKIREQIPCWFTAIYKQLLCYVCWTMHSFKRPSFKIKCFLVYCVSLFCFVSCLHPPPCDPEIHVSGACSHRSGEQRVTLHRRTCNVGFKQKNDRQVLQLWHLTGSPSRWLLKGVDVWFYWMAVPSPSYISGVRGSLSSVWAEGGGERKRRILDLRCATEDLPVGGAIGIITSSF